MAGRKRTDIEKTSTMTAVFNKYGDIDGVRLRGETYEGDGGFVHIPISSLEDIHLNEIPQDVGIYPVVKVIQKGLGKEVQTLDFPIPLMTDVVVYNSSASIHMHGYTKYWTEMLGLMYYMDLLSLSIIRLQKDNPDISFQEYTNDGDVHFFVDFDIILDSALTFPQAIEKIRKVFSLVNNSLEEVTESLRVFIQRQYTDVEQNIKDKWDESLNSRNPNEKGKALEELIVLIATTIKGFIPTYRVRTETEEIDISVRNESKDPFWSKFTPFILVECKNWSTSCGKNEVVLFRDKLTNRFGVSQLGFLVSMNGFKDTVTKEMLRGSKGEYLVVPVGGNSLKELVFSKDRNSLLKSYVERSVFT